MSKNADLFHLRIQKVVRETPDTKSFVLVPQDSLLPVYRPGQFLTFLFEKRDGSEARRNYSISAVPALHEPLKITVKRIPNGEFSRKLVDDAGEGTILRSTGASGFFTLPDQPQAAGLYLFFAAGSGITPVFALIGTLLYEYADTRVVLIYSNTSASQTIFYRELLTLQQAFPDRFQIEFFFSSSDAVQGKRLSGFRVMQLLEQYAGSEKKRALFYLCGPFEYMRMITIVLLSNGIVAGQIRREIFVIEKPVANQRPPDVDLHRISIFREGMLHTFETQYPETILQAAKRIGIALPYSCESGQCGTCAATCISGKIWMLRNEVLLDTEMGKGRVLTCTGYAIGGDAALVY